MMLPESTKTHIYGSNSYAFYQDYKQPELVIVRQPKKRGYRFRYQSEGKTHGMLPGEPFDNDELTKVFPTIKLERFSGKAKVVLFLVTDKDPKFIHPHTLLIDKAPVPGYHITDINGGEELELKNVAIQHVNKQESLNKLMDRELQSNFAQGIIELAEASSYATQRPIVPSIDIYGFVDCLKDKPDNVKFFNRQTKTGISEIEFNQLESKAKKKQKEINMSSCRLCFLAFLCDKTTGKFDRVIPPVYSHEIIDGKKKEGAPLKIIRMSHVAGSVEGGKEVWLLSDKIDADDTEVHFWERGENQESWEGFGIFNKTDIYKQSLIVFKTPPYADQNIDQPRTVNLQLRRKKDRNCVSDVHHFSYKPKHYDRYGLLDKRRKNLPPEIDDAPMVKRQAVEYSESSSISTKWSPYEATQMKNVEPPSLSDLINQNTSNTVNAVNAVATITGTVGHGLANTNKDLFAPQSNIPLTRFLNDYNNGRSDVTDDSDTE